MTPETPGLEGRFVRSERMVGRSITGEYILVPIVGHGAEVDSIFNLNRVGAFIWERLDGTASGAGIVDALVETFEVERSQAEADYREFLAKLLSVGAVEPVE
jgi:hypothetical protein